MVTITHYELIAVGALVSAVIFYALAGIYLYRWKQTLETTEEEKRAAQLRKEVALLTVALRQAEQLLKTQDKKRQFSPKRG